MKIRATSLLLFLLSSVATAETLDAIDALLQQGRWEPALETIETQLEQTPGDKAWLFQKARALTAGGKTKQAEQLYRQLLKQQPQMVEAYNNLAAILIGKGQLEQASELLEQALKNTDPAYAMVYENLQTVNVEIARASYGQALRVDVPQRQLQIRQLGLRDRPSVTAKPALQVAKAEASVSESAPAAEPVSARAEPVVEMQVEASPASLAAQDIQTTVQAWASAWAAQEVDLYLSFYAAGFQTPDALARAEWEAQRRYRLKQPQWIRVTLADIKLASVTEQQAIVEFMQEYASDTYADKTRKQLVLTRQADGWRILAENSL